VDQDALRHGARRAVVALIVVIYAFVSIIGFSPMASRASASSPPRSALAPFANVYALILIGITAIYVIKAA